MYFDLLTLAWEIVSAQTIKMTQVSEAMYIYIYIYGYSYSYSYLYLYL